MDWTRGERDCFRLRRILWRLTGIFEIIGVLEVDVFIWSRQRIELFQDLVFAGHKVWEERICKICGCFEQLVRAVNEGGR